MRLSGWGLVALISWPLFQSARAEACSGQELPPRLFAPNDQETISRDSHLLLGVGHFGRETELRLLSASRSAELMFDVQRLSLVGFGTLLVLRPVTRFDPATASLFIGGLEGQPETVAHFQPSEGESIAPPVEPVGLSWFDQLNIAPTRNSCFSQFHRAMHLQVELAAPIPRSSYLIIRVEGVDGAGQADVFEVAQYQPDVTSLEFNQELPPRFEPSCIEVATVAADGSESTPKRVCAADKCALFDSSGFEVFQDWSNVPDGCALNCTLGQDGYTCTEGHVQLPETPGDGLREAEASCGCTSAERRTSPLWALLLMPFVLLRRRAWLALLPMLALLPSERAEACSPAGYLRPEVHYPQHPNMPVYGGAILRIGALRNVEVTVSQNGQPANWTIEKHASSLVDSILVLRSVEPASGEYSISVTEQGETETLVTFQATTTATVIPAAVQPVSVEWVEGEYRESMCGPGGQRYYILRTKLHEPLADSTYLIVEARGTKNGVAHQETYAERQSGMYTVSFQNDRRDDFQIECFSVRMASVDGSESAAVETCEVVEDSESGGCSATHGSEGAAAWVLVPLLAMLMLRRRAWLVLVPLAMLPSERAEACSEAYDVPKLVYPQRPYVRPDVGILISGWPYGAQQAPTLRKDGVVIEWEVERLGTFLILRPGDAERGIYSLTVPSPHRADEEEELGQFLVTDTATLTALILPPVEPSNIDWTVRSYEESSCGPASESYIFEVSFDGELPQTSLVVVHVSGKFRGGMVDESYVLQGPDPTRAVLEREHPDELEIECVRARVISIDGRESESVETCDAPGCACTSNASTTPAWALLAVFAALIFRKRALLGLVAVAALAAPERAEACSPDRSSPPVVLYPPGNVIPPNTSIIMAAPRYAEWDLTTLRNDMPTG